MTLSDTNSLALLLETSLIPSAELAAMSEKWVMLQFSTNSAATSWTSMPGPEGEFLPRMDRPRRRTMPPAVLIETPFVAVEIVPAVPVQSMVMDLLMFTRPNSPASTQLISPPGSATSWASWKVAHGAARVQVAPAPVPDTNVRGTACADVVAATMANSAAEHAAE